MDFEIVGDKGLQVSDFEVIERGTVLMKYLKHPCQAMTQQTIIKTPKCFIGQEKTLLYFMVGMLVFEIAYAL